MRNSFPNSLSQLNMVMYFLVWIFLTHCSWTPKVETSIYQGEEGSIGLMTMDEGTFRTEHPITLDSPTLKRILSGLYVQHQNRLLQRLIGEKENLQQIFTVEQIEFLTPHLVDAFSQATPEEMITFSVQSQLSQGIGPIKGVSFFKNGKLAVTMVHLPATTSKTTKLERLSTTTNQSLQGSTKLFFIPTEAGYYFKSPITTSGQLKESSLVIDYEYMKKPHSGTPAPKSVMSETMAPNSKNLSEAPIPESPPESLPNQHTGTSDQGIAEQSVPSNPTPNVQDLLEQMKELNQELKKQKEEIDRLKYQLPQKQ